MKDEKAQKPEKDKPEKVDKDATIKALTLELELVREKLKVSVVRVHELEKTCAHVQSYGVMGGVGFSAKTREEILAAVTKVLGK